MGVFPFLTLKRIISPLFALKIKLRGIAQIRSICLDWREISYIWAGIALGENSFTSKFEGGVNEGVKIAKIVRSRADLNPFDEQSRKSRWPVPRMCQCEPKWYDDFELLPLFITDGGGWPNENTWSHQNCNSRWPGHFFFVDPSLFTSKFVKNLNLDDIQKSAIPGN